MDMSRNWHLVTPEESRVVWADGQQWFASVWLNTNGEYEGVAMTQHDNTSTPVFIGEDATAKDVLDRVLRSIECGVFGLANVCDHLAATKDLPLQNASFRG